ncbi:MAG TPA: mannose-6-phosphate isomerase, class I [Thermoanaerobaculia bacterium]|nr:mannose-6-phosphate isomerase, class I [Thermoanaerobaculia bacterium]
MSETDPHPVSPLPGLIPLEGVVRHYDWGSRTFLAALRHHPQPSAEPEAELWYGAHPTAPSPVRLGGDELSLDALIGRHAAEVLGAASGTGAGDATRPEQHELPFLLKVLAADRPLSIQLHPDGARARAGFEREEAQGIDRSASRRLYPDSNPKPEIACALTPFEALQSLRPPLEVRSLVASLGCPEADALLGRADPEDPAALLAAILSLGESEASALATATARAAQRSATPEGAWVARLAESYPRDPLILAPLLLHLVELVPGEALYTPPGVIHSYLEGAAVELMGASDNVLRAGLTRKPVDSDELLAALDPAPRQPAILVPREVAGSAWREYPDTGPIRLSFADVEWDGALAVETIGHPCILLAISGHVRARSSDGAELELRPGDAALVPAAAPGYRLEGVGRIYRASAAG